MILFNHIHGLVDNGQGAQTQKIHFQQTDFLYVFFGKLGDNTTLCRFLQRQIGIQRVSGNYHTGCVSARMTRQTFQFLCCFD